MPMFKNVYECPCGTTWEDEWDCTCDDRCPQCNTSCSPSFSYNLDNPVQVNEMIRGRSKVDMQMITLDSLFIPSRWTLPSIIMDECHYIEPKDMWLRPETREKDWDRKTFKSGPATTPSEAVRQKRREERKRKKGSK